MEVGGEGEKIDKTKNNKELQPEKVKKISRRKKKFEDERKFKGIVGREGTKDNRK